MDRDNSLGPQRKLFFRLSVVRLRRRVVSGKQAPLVAHKFNQSLLPKVSSISTASASRPCTKVLASTDLPCRMRTVVVGDEVPGDVQTGRGVDHRHSIDV